APTLRRDVRRTRVSQRRRVGFVLLRRVQSLPDVPKASRGAFRARDRRQSPPAPQARRTIRRLRSDASEPRRVAAAVPEWFPPLAPEPAILARPASAQPSRIVDELR